MPSFHVDRSLGAEHGARPLEPTSPFAKKSNRDSRFTNHDELLNLGAMSMCKG